MEKLNYILILFVFTISPILALSQNDEIIINNIGMLDDDNQYYLDGGMGYLGVIIDCCKIKKNKIKLKGQLIDLDTKEQVPYFYIFVAENNNIDYCLSIKDTLVNRKETN